jgi:hypothetical protein
LETKHPDEHQKILEQATAEKQNKKAKTSNTPKQLTLEATVERTQGYGSEFD